MEDRVIWAFCAVSITTALFGAQVRVEVRLVNVFATVTDDRGDYVHHLTAGDFVVEDNGVRQEIAHFSQDRDVPVSVGIVLDTSGSMERKIRTAITAIERFTHSIHNDDDIFLMTFSDRPALRQEFTNDRDRLMNALRRIRVAGGTSLYDALGEALDIMRQGRHDKRAILLITDGQDTTSRERLHHAVQAVRESHYLVYALGISPMTYVDSVDHVPFTWPTPSVPGRLPAPATRDAVDMNVLRNFAESSGGRAFLLSESVVGGRGTEIDKVLDEVAAELRSQYTLGYYPTHPDDGKFHAIRVITREGLRVRARTGYIAPGG